MSKAHETIEMRKGSMNLTAPRSICLTNVNSPQARTTLEFPRSSVPVTTMNPRFKEIQKYLSGIIKPTNQRTSVRQPRTRTMRGFAQNTDPELKPAILETRISQNENFMTLSDGFKRLFSNDKKDKKMVLPIAGYGGHRRGDRSQNFFGKSFRQSSYQSKKLERSLRCSTAV